MIPEILKLMTIAASLIAAFRILFYQRNGRFKFWFSAIAWALAFFMIAQAITLILSVSSHPTFYQTGTAIFLMLAIMRAKGNVACFFYEGSK